MGVGGMGEFLNIQDGQRRIGNRLPKNGLGVGTESGVQFFLRAVGRDKGSLYAHLGHGDSNEVEGAAIDAGGADQVIAALSHIEQGEEVGRLTGGSEHGCGAPFQVGDLGSYIVVGGVLKAGVEVALRFQIKELAHILAGVIFKGRGLNDRNLAGFAVAGGVATLDAFGIDLIIAHSRSILFCFIGYLSIPVAQSCTKVTGCPSAGSSFSRKSAVLNWTVEVLIQGWQPKALCWYRSWSMSSVT